MYLLTYMKVGGQTSLLDLCYKKWGSDDPLDPMLVRSMLNKKAHLTTAERCTPTN